MINIWKLFSALEAVQVLLFMFARAWLLCICISDMVVSFLIILGAIMNIDPDWIGPDQFNFVGGYSKVFGTADPYIHIYSILFTGLAVHGFLKDRIEQTLPFISYETVYVLQTLTNELSPSFRKHAENPVFMTIAIALFTAVNIIVYLTCFGSNKPALIRIKLDSNKIIFGLDQNVDSGLRIVDIGVTVKKGLKMVQLGPKKYVFRKERPAAAKKAMATKDKKEKPARPQFTAINVDDEIPPPADDSQAPPAYSATVDEKQPPIMGV